MTHHLLGTWIKPKRDGIFAQWHVLREVDADRGGMTVMVCGTAFGRKDVLAAEGFEIIVGDAEPPGVGNENCPVCLGAMRAAS